MKNKSVNLQQQKSEKIQHRMSYNLYSDTINQPANS